MHVRSYLKSTIKTCTNRTSEEPRAVQSTGYADKWRNGRSAAADGSGREQEFFPPPRSPPGQAEARAHALSLRDWSSLRREEMSMSMESLPTMSRSRLAGGRGMKSSSKSSSSSPPSEDEASVLGSAYWP